VLCERRSVEINQVEISRTTSKIQNRRSVFFPLFVACKKLWHARIFSNHSKLIGDYCGYARIFFHLRGISASLCSIFLTQQITRTNQQKFFYSICIEIFVAVDFFFATLTIHLIQKIIANM
jgi:hypothetical protein